LSSVVDDNCIGSDDFLLVL